MRVRALLVVLAALMVAGPIVAPSPAPAAATTQPQDVITTEPMPAGTSIEWDSPEQVALRLRTDDCGPVSALTAEERAEVCGRPLTTTPAYADPEIQERLADFSMSVSQTQNLRNQVVQVRWDSGLSERADIQIMQCWSASPTTAPDREQCEFGGKNVSDRYETGSDPLLGESREPGSQDPEYRGFSTAVSWAAIDGQSANPIGSPDWAGRERTDPLFGTWQSPSELQLGLDDALTGFASYEITLIPPSGAVRPDGTVLPSRIPLLSESPFPNGVPTSIPGRAFPYDFVTEPVSLVTAASIAEIPEEAWPSGRYEIELAQTIVSNGQESIRRDRIVLVREDRFVEDDFRAVWRQGGSGESPILTIPFDPFGEADTRRPTSDSYPLSLTEWINTRSTNEVVRAPGVVSGTGAAAFEVLTDLESQGLACGRPANPAATCWLVAVPRFARPADANVGIGRSPLDLFFWDLRINVRLGFVPTVTDCDASGDLAQVYVNDIGHTAVASWQAALCRVPGAEATVSRPQQDFQVRDLVAAPNRLGIVGVPAESPTQVKAPLAAAGLAFAFAIDELWYGPRLPPEASGQAGERNQTRVTTMNLTPRLVAKLLTQSYTTGALPNGPAGSQNIFGREPAAGETFSFEPERNLDPDNATNLLTDPEFLAVNPQIQEWVTSWSNNGQQLPVGLQQNLATVIFADVAADSYNAMWQWILSDESAREFLAGDEDDNGMTVNPYHENAITAASDGIRLRDSTCADYLTEGFERVEDICTINFQSRSETILEPALYASRGDSRRQVIEPQINCDPRVNAASCLWRRESRQSVATGDATGVALIALTTTALAQRLGLPVAALGESEGEFVKPSAETVATAVDAMSMRDDGALLPAPSEYPDNAYPLTALSYGVVDVCQATPAERESFAAIFDYAATDGQQVGSAPGQLPPGYSPLPAQLVEQTRNAATTLRNPPAELLGGCVEDPAPAPPSSGTAGSPSSSGGGSPPLPPASPAAPLPPVPPLGTTVPAVGLPPDAAPSADAAASPETLDIGSGAARAATPVAEGAHRWLIPLVLALGLVAAVAGPALAVVSRRRRG